MLVNINKLYVQLTNPQFSKQPDRRQLWRRITCPIKSNDASQEQCGSSNLF
jgi:hypothetical protein